MVKGVFDELKKPRPKNHFTIGIHDDVTHTSLAYDPDFSTEDPRTVRALFYGLGSDGTVGANKNSIKIIGSETPNYAQGYFVYDSKKSGSVTTSHLRFGPDPIRSTYLITQGEFYRLPPVSVSGADGRSGGGGAGRGLPAELALWAGRDLAASAAQDAGDDHREEAAVLCDRRLHGGARSRAWATASTPSCRPASSPSAACCRAKRRSQQIKKAIKKTYGKRGDAVVQQNFAAVDAALAHLHQVHAAGEGHARRSTFCRCSRARRRLCARRAGRDGCRPRRSAAGQRAAGGRDVPDRHRAMGEAQHRAEIPVWDKDLCIQCGKCVHGLPARGDPRQGLRRELAAPSARRPSRRAKPKWRGMEQRALHPAGCAGRLHRLPSLRGGLPGEEQERSQAQGASTWSCRRRCARPK